ncbi:MAG: hypothetical protein IPH79_03080 [Sphingomonadales bacterium]|nr:hypothetical protein [Sphingomonadales bacterium]
MIVIAGFALALGVAYSAQGQSLTSIIDLLDGTRDFQLRVEQRVIVRFPNQPVTVSSGRGDNRKSVIYNEEKIGKCLLLDRLIASRPGPKNTLELVTRERQLIRAYLGDGCLAREFYAGAYVERSKDGKLCIDRDLMHARTGAKCEIDKFRLLVPE